MKYELYILNCQRITIKDYVFPGHHTCSAGLTLIFRGSFQSPEQYSSYSTVNAYKAPQDSIFQKFHMKITDNLKILR